MAYTFRQEGGIPIDVKTGRLGEVNTPQSAQTGKLSAEEVNRLLQSGQAKIQRRTQNIQAQPSQKVIPEPSEGGFIQQLLQPMTRTIATVGRAGRTAERVIGKQGISGIGQLARAEFGREVNPETQRVVEEEKRRLYDFGALGTARPVAGAKEALGVGAEIVSLGIGGGGVVATGRQLLKGATLQAVKAGAKAGAVSGVLGSGGSELAEGGTFGEAALSGAVGGAIGGTVGALTSALTPIVFVARKAFTPFEKQAEMAIRSAVEKAVPIRITKGVDVNVAKKATQQAFKIIHKLRPEIKDEFGDVISDLPRSRLELLQAHGESMGKIFKGYNDMVVKAGGFKYDPTIQNISVKGGKKSIVDIFKDISKSAGYTTDLKRTASNIAREIGGLKDATPETIQTYIKNINGKARAALEGKKFSPEADLYATAANKLNEALEESIEKTLGKGKGKQYGALRDSYSALKKSADAIVRAARAESNTGKLGAVDMVKDLFTGQQLGTFLITGSPTSLASAATAWIGSGVWKHFTQPDKYIRNAFKAMDLAETGAKPIGVRAVQAVKKQFIK